MRKKSNSADLPQIGINWGFSNTVQESGQQRTSSNWEHEKTGAQYGLFPYEIFQMPSYLCWAFGARRGERPIVRSMLCSSFPLANRKKEGSMPERISDKQVACAYLSHSGKPNHPLIRILKASTKTRIGLRELLLRKWRSERKFSTQPQPGTHCDGCA